MISDKDFSKLLNESVYYYTKDDIVEPTTSKKLKARLVSTDKGQDWIPIRASRPFRVVNINTGELVEGYLVKKDFLKADKRNRKEILRKNTGLDYDQDGTFVRLKNGWTIYDPNLF